MASNNQVLFSRGNKNDNDDDDVWDDRALINAYDKSIRRIKKEIGEKLNAKQHSQNTTTLTTMPTSSTCTDNDIDLEEQASSSDETQSTWKVGDVCIGVYEEDGLDYPARIIKLIGKDKCEIQYDHYLNVEEKAFSELKPIKANETIKKQSKKSSVVKTTNASKPNNANKSQETNVGRPSKTFAFPSASCPMTLPPPPPPPPPALPSSLMSKTNSSEKDEAEKTVSEEEALYSMLMSWYMSGYHTGYFYGLNAKSKQAQ